MNTKDTIKSVVIYHKADYDGIFSRETARIFLLNNVEFIGWDYGDEIPSIQDDVQLYMIDISVEPLMTFPNLIWIDHHKSAIEKYSHLNIDGYRIDGVAACRLAYQWFSNIDGLPKKESFLERKVKEPLALTLAGEYDVWDHRSDSTKIFQFGLDSTPDLDFDLLFRYDKRAVDYTHEIINNGKSAMNCYMKRDADVMRDKSFISEWEGLRFLTLNSPKCNSKTFSSKDLPITGHDALMAFYYNGKSWNFSLYHSEYRKDIDLSLIASKYGGGGHRGACGFCLSKLPF
jgi:oligoribonuclease NrnB/cAMP/cGMP phosphodiesterase (DHH superfamily)